jgi:hypothetical protein
MLPSADNYKPESISSTIFELDHASQSSDVCLIEAGILNFWISFCTRVSSVQVVSGLCAYRSLKNVDVQTATDMPRDMAMKGPNRGIILGPLENNITGCDGSIIGLSRLHKLNVAHLGVRWVDNCAIPCTYTFIEDMEVVAVKMDRMGHEKEVVEDQADGGVGAKIEDVPLRLKRKVALVDCREQSMIVVGTECTVVHEPDEVGAVGAESDIDSLNRSWYSLWGHLAESGCKAQIVVATVLELRSGPTRSGIR